MNYLGIISLLVAMIFSWKLPLLESPPSLAVHVEIQNEMVNLIREAAVSQIPRAETVRMDKVWTKATHDKEVRVEFDYTILSDLGERLESNKGIATVSKNPDAIWKIHTVQINSTTVNLNDGTTVDLND